MSEVVNHNGLLVHFRPRLKEYIFIHNEIKYLYKAIVKLIGSRAKIIFKSRGDELIVKEFFLLELDYVLTKLSEPNNIGLLARCNNLYYILLDYLRNQTWLKDRYTDVPFEFDFKRMKRLMKFDILPHQRAAFEKYEEIKRIADLRGYLIDAAAGTGKTFTSLALGEALDYDHMMIICPRQVLETVWVSSIGDPKSTLYKKPQTYVVLPETNGKWGKERFILMHYEYLMKIMNNEKLLKQICRRKPMLIIDEWHNFNEITSKRTQILKEFVDYVDFKDIVLLTGTPIKMSPMELIPMLFVLDKKFPPALEQFKMFYSSLDLVTSELIQYRFNLYRRRIEKDKDMLPPIEIKEMKVKIRDAKKYTLPMIKKEIEEYKKKRLDELLKEESKYRKRFEELLEIAKRRLIKEKTIPKKAIEEIYKEYLSLVKRIREMHDTNKLMLARALMKEAKEIEENYIEPYLEGEELKEFRSIKSIIKFPILKVMGEALGRILLQRRIECYTELAKTISYKEITKKAIKKTLVFSNYVVTCEAAYKKAKSEGLKPLRVYGEYTDRLTETVNKFMTDPKYDPLIATYKSLSTGVPLIAANVMVCLDIPFRMHIFDQAVARVHRLGQDKPVVVYIVKLDTGNIPNITEKDLFILNMSKLNIDLITGNKFPFELPEQEIKDVTEEELDEEDIIREEIEETVENEFASSIFRSVIHDLFKKIKIGM